MVIVRGCIGLCYLIFSQVDEKLRSGGEGISYLVANIGVVEASTRRYETPCGFFINPLELE